MAITIERLIAQVEANPAGAIAALEALSVAVDAAARDRTANIDVDIDDDSVARAGLYLDNLGIKADKAGNKTGNLKAVWGQMGAVMAVTKWGAIYGGLTLVTGAVQTLSGAAVGAVATLTPLAGILATLPLGMGVLGGSLGTVLLGFSGVSQGASALSQATKGTSSAFGSASDKARAYRDANWSLRDALEGVKDAEYGLAQATKGVTEARRQAVLDIRDGSRAVTDSVWRQEDAVTGLAEAQKRLSRLQGTTHKNALTFAQEVDDFTGKVYDVARMSGTAVDQAEEEANAKRDVARAQEEIKRAQEDGIEVQKRYNELVAKGVEGSDRVQEALRGQQMAARSLRSAREGVIRAKEAIGDLAKNAGGAAAAGLALKEAFDQLSPAGQRFAKFINSDLKPALKELRFAAQEGLLPGVQEGLTTLLSHGLPGMKREVSRFSKALGDSFSEWADFLVLPENKRKIQKFADFTYDILVGGTDKYGKSLKGLLDIGKPLTSMLLDISNAAGPLSQWLTDSFVKSMESIASWAKTDLGQNRMATFFEETYKFTKLWWAALKPLGLVLGDVIKAATPLATWMLESIAGYFGDLHDKTSKSGESMQRWFDGTKPMIGETMGLLKDLGKAFLDATPTGKDSAWYRTVVSLREDFIPAFREMIRVFDESDMGPTLANLLTSITKVFTVLSENEGPLQVIFEAITKLGDAFLYLDDVTDGASTKGLIAILLALGAAKIASGFVGSLKTMATNFGLSKTAAAGAGDAIGTAAGKTGFLRGALGKTTAGLGARGLMGAAGGLVRFLGGPWGVGIGLGITALSLWSSAQEKARDKVIAHQESLAALRGTLDGTGKVTTNTFDTKYAQLKDPTNAGYASALALQERGVSYVDVVLAAIGNPERLRTVVSELETELSTLTTQRDALDAEFNRQINPMAYGDPTEDWSAPGVLDQKRNRLAELTSGVEERKINLNSIRGQASDIDRLGSEERKTNEELARGRKLVTESATPKRERVNAIEWQGTTLALANAAASYTEVKVAADKAAKAVTDEAIAQGNALMKHTSLFASKRDADRANRASIEATTEAIKAWREEHSKPPKVNTPEFDRMNALLDQEALSAQSAAQGQLLHGDSVNTVGKRMQENREKFIQNATAILGNRDAAVALADKLGITVDWVDAANTALGKVPPVVPTEVKLNRTKFEEGITSLKSTLTDIDGKEVTIYVNLTEKLLGISYQRYKKTIGKAMHREGAATGGAIWGPGTETSDSIPMNLSKGEHVLTAAEVKRMGGQNAVYSFRNDLMSSGYDSQATLPTTDTGPRDQKTLTMQDVERLVAKIAAVTKPQVDMKVDMNQHVDPKILSRELAWGLR